MKRSIIFIALMACLTSVTYLWQQRTFGNEKYERIVDSDGKGYVAYLPAIIIYHDLSFEYYFKSQNQKIARYFNQRFLTKQNDKTVLKTYAGVAVLMAPFYLIGCLAQIVIHGATNGYESLVQFFISIAAIFYALSGLFLIYKTLRLLNFNRLTCLLTATMVFAASNLCYYALFHPTMSHAYSFFFITVFIYLSVCLSQQTQNRFLLGLALTLALITLVRPLNFIVILFPLLYFGKQKLLDIIKSKTVILLLSGLLFLMIISIQPILNFIQCGMFFPWSYGDEGFYFTNPALFKTLFSFRNGLFIYSPLLLLLIPGLWLLSRHSLRLSMASATLIVLVWYLLSSWWNWSSEPAFGNRSFIDWYGLMALPIAASINLIWQKNKILLSLFCLGVAGLNTLQTWQYLNDIIHPDGMNFKKYSYVFLKTSSDYFASVGNGNEEAYLPQQDAPFYTTLLFPEITESPTSKLSSLTFRFDKQTNRNAWLTIPSATNLQQPMKAIVSLQRKEHEFKACTQATVCFDYADKNGNVYYNENLRINDIPREKINEWMLFNYEFVMPAIRNAEDRVTFYINNPKGSDFEIKNIALKLYNFKSSR